MPNSKQIVYLSQAQYAELIANGSITVDGVTVTYDENDIYVTPQAEPITDVRVNGTSIAANGVANIPIMSNVLGVAKVNPAFGIYSDSNGSLQVISQNANLVKLGTDTFRPVVSSTQDSATFYGLAKAAGHDEKNSTEPLGTYTPEAKGAIQQMLGVSDLIATEENNLVASKAYAIGDIFTANGKLYKATAAIAADGAIITDGANANCVETSVGEGFVKFTDYATSSTPGVMIVRPFDGHQVYQGHLIHKPAASHTIKSGTDPNDPIVSSNQHESVFYGLAKVAGDTTQSASDNSVGTYTDTAKAAIRNMIGASSTNVIAVQDTQPTDTDTKVWLPETAETPVEVPTVAEMNAALAGKVGDIQIDGTSVVSNGVANIPVASATQLGLVKGYNLRGIGINTTNEIFLQGATAQQCKTRVGSTGYQPLTVYTEDASTFYGLAYAAGDTTMSSSSNAVGTYTDSAKASIKAMLGIQDGSTGTVDVTGTTPTITAVENTRYVCGEVTSLNFTPAANGICIVRFTSGSTVTVLTIPSTVKFPEWFDPTSLETNTIYEICITDGVYGAVMSWAL